MESWRDDEGCLEWENEAKSHVDMMNIQIHLQIRSIPETNAYMKSSSLGDWVHNVEGRVHPRIIVLEHEKDEMKFEMETQIANSIATTVGEREILAIPHQDVEIHSILAPTHDVVGMKSTDETEEVKDCSKKQQR